MALPRWIEQALHQEDINFILTNRVPRRLLTWFMGWFSRIEQPLVRDTSLAAFALFAGDLRLDEAKKTAFTSLHDCFVRELKDGARPVDPDHDVLVSPCDGIVGPFGAIDDVKLVQAKGSRYTLEELLGDRDVAERYRGGSFLTVRLAARMYHHFHAPCDIQLDGATYIAGDTWNVNPATLGRVARVYCRNERAVLHARISGTDDDLALVAVGAILVGSVQLSCLGGPLKLPGRRPRHVPCAASYRKGDDLGYFHHGSTVIVITNADAEVCGHVRSGRVVRMGEALFRRR